MDCLIELYDHDQLNNLVDILLFALKKWYLFLTSGKPGARIYRPSS